MIRDSLAETPAQTAAYDRTAAGVRAHRDARWLRGIVADVVEQADGPIDERARMRTAVDAADRLVGIAREALADELAVLVELTTPAASEAGTR